MKNLKISPVLVFLVIGLCVLSMAFIFGCGTTPTSGGGGGGNKGTISGHAYVCDYEGGTYTGTSEVIIYVSTEAMSQAAVTTTDANGAYTLTGLPSGKIALTATREGNNPITIVADSSTVNFVVSSDAIGDATISGTIEGVAGGTTVHLKFSSCPATDADFYCSDNLSFDPVTMTYQVPGVPLGEVYVGAWTTEAGTTRYAYNKTTISSSGTHYMNITFEAGGVTIEATHFSVPPGYTFSGLGVRVAKSNDTTSVSVGNEDITSGTTFRVDDLPTLKAGDKYTVRISATNEANTYRRYYPNKTAGSYTFDDDSTTIIPSQIMITPASGTFETSTAPATLEWNSVTGANCYSVTVNNGGWTWYIYTDETSITIPQCILDIMPPGENRVFVSARHYPGGIQYWDLKEFTHSHFNDWVLSGPD